MIEIVRTKRQHMARRGDVRMPGDIRTILERTGDTLVWDALGVAALVVILLGSLSLPAFL
jgi:hypothetical protein